MSEINVRSPLPLPKAVLIKHCPPNQLRHRAGLEETSGSILVPIIWSVYWHDSLFSATNQETENPWHDFRVSLSRCNIVGRFTGDFSPSCFSIDGFPLKCCGVDLHHHVTSMVSRWHSQVTVGITVFRRSASPSQPVCGALLFAHPANAHHYHHLNL